VFNGTAPNVRAGRTLAYVGRIVGYNNDLDKWEVHSNPKPNPYANPNANPNPLGEPLTTTSATRRFKIGDLVQVFNGTAPNVRAGRTLAYVGRIVGYNNDLDKWEVHSNPKPNPYANPYANPNPSGSENNVVEAWRSQQSRRGIYESL
jgi:hypothetical protein